MAKARNAFEPGQPVFGKMRGSPWWPGHIPLNSDTDVPPCSASTIVVKFFQTNDYGLLKRKDVVSITDPKAKRFGNNKIIQDAMAKLSMYVFDHRSDNAAEKAYIEDSSDSESETPKSPEHPMGDGSDSEDMPLASLRQDSPRRFGCPPATVISQPVARKKMLDSDSSYVPSADEAEKPKTPPKVHDTSAAPQPTAATVDSSTDSEVAGPKPKRLRRKKAVKSEWKVNKQQYNRAHGLSSIDYKGREKDMRLPIPSQCEKCRFKCSEKFSDYDRVVILQSYWSLGDKARHMDFLNQHQEPFAVQRPSSNPTRNQSWAFHFEKDGEKIRVCKDFFLKTLGLNTDSSLKFARKNRGSQGEFVGKDMRGHQPPKSKYSDIAISMVKDHIRSFPTMNSHYTRKDSKRKYLGADLNLSKMYDLYLEWAQNDKNLPVDSSDIVKKQQYRKIFNSEEFNLGFFLPKKDACATCDKLESLEGDAKEAYNREVIIPHKERKAASREAKNADKKSAQSDPSHVVATHDLQSVLYTPSSEVSTLYYLRKLGAYNHTIYELASKRGICHFWDESTAKRGANEIGSSLLLFLEGLPNCVKKVTFYADCCAVNRNQYVSIALLHKVANSEFLEEIEQKFLESGHTQMEVDSMHSAIEIAKKGQKINVPMEWEVVLRSARRSKPYEIENLTKDNVFDLKKLAIETGKLPAKNTDKEKINWMKTKWFSYRKGSASSIFYKESFSDQEPFKEMKIVQVATRRSKSAALTPAYSSKIPISAPKKADLLKMVKDGVIRPEYADFYEKLPTASGAKDFILEEEEDVD